MSEDIASLALKVDASQVATGAAELDKLQGAGKRAAEGVNTAEGAAKKLGVSLSGVNPLLGAFGVSLGAVGLAQLTKDILDTNREMESLRARLKAITGSAEEAQRSFSFIQQFAKDTPFEIADVTKAFITLQNFGIKPTAEVMNSLTNQAAKSGASAQNLEGISLALGQAWAKGKLQGQEILQLINQSVPVYELLSQVTGQNSAALAEMSEKGLIGRDVISQLIVKMGELATGSNAAAMDTLNGKISNLADAWHTFEDALLNDRSEGLLKGIVDSMTNMLSGLSSLMSNTLDAQLSRSREKIEAFRQANFLEKGIAKLGGFDIDTEVAKSNFLQSQINLENDYKAAKEAQAKATEKVTGAEVAQHVARTAHHSARKTGMSEEQRAAKALANEYNNLVAHLERELALSSDPTSKIAALEYDVTRGKLARLNEEKKLYLLQLQAEIVNKEKDSKANEAKKNELDALIDKYNQLTLSARDYYKLSLTTKGIAPDQQGALLQQFDKNAGAEAKKKSQDDANASLKSYIDNLDTARDKTLDLGAVTRATFDGALGGVSLLAGAFTSMIKQINDNTAALKENQKQLAFANNDPIRNMAAIAKLKAEGIELEKKNTAISLAGVRQIAGATSTMFKENSTARKAFHAIEMALGAVEIAQQLKQLIPLGSAAILTQGKGDPYSAFFRIAAMTAIVGGIIAAAGGSFSGGGGGGAAPKTDDGTGTVLGDNKAVSESAGKTYQLLKDIHADEYAELRGINSGVAKLNGDIVDTITNVFQSGGLKEIFVDTKTQLSGIGKLIQAGSGPGALDPISNKLLGFIFGTTKKSVEEQGIEIGRSAIKNVLAGRNVKSNQFTRVKIKKSSLFGSSTSYEDIRSPLDKSVRDSLTKVYKSIGSTMLELSQTFGGDTAQKIQNYIVPALKVDLKGLNAEEASKKLTGAISAQMDKMAGRVFGPVLKQYQNLGEGLYETAVRLVAQVGVARNAVARSGLSIEADAIGIANALVKAAGGLQEFQKQIETYFDKFYSEGEKQGYLYYQLSWQLGAVGKALPATREGYRQLVESLNLSTAAGQAQYSTLIKLAGAADEYYSKLEEGQQKLIESQKSTLSASISNITSIINSLVGGVKSILDPVTSLGVERGQAKNFLLDQLGLLNKGKGNLLDATGITDAVNTLSKPSEQLFKTQLDFKRESIRTANLLSSFADRATAQRNVWQQQLDVLNKIAVTAEAVRIASEETQKTSKRVSDILTIVTRGGESMVTVAA